MKHILPILLAACAIFLAGCGPLYGPTALTPTRPPATPTVPPTVSSTRTPTAFLPPSPTVTRKPRTLVFYGDSVLKVGDVSKEGAVGFSFVDAIHPQLDPADSLVVQNHGGKSAQWGFENLKENVLDHHPDLVTLWWGMNDLGGCPGIFDDTSRYPVQSRLDAYIKQSIQSMRAQIDALLAQSASVIVMTALPVDGTLPWTHFTADNQLVWENDHRCNYNLGLEQLVAAQRQMAAEYAAQRRPVALVDVWQIYQDHQGEEKMYMDIVHPASHGAELIAAGWMKVYNSLER
jgi:lysophospholipase L1-like esterase